MNYEKLNKEIKDALNFELTEENIKNLIHAIEQHHKENTFLKVNGENRDKEAFKEASKPLVKYLCENHHPHVTVIVTPTGAELLEGLKTTKIEDYIRD